MRVGSSPLLRPYTHLNRQIPNFGTRSVPKQPILFRAYPSLAVSLTPPQLQQAIFDTFKSQLVPIVLKRAAKIAKLETEHKLTPNSPILHSSYIDLSQNRTNLSLKDIQTYVDSRWRGYLATHLLSLRQAFISGGTYYGVPDQKLSTLDPSMRFGIQDAKEVVYRRLNVGPVRVPDANATSIIDPNLFQLIRTTPKVLLHEHYRGAVPDALVRALAIRIQEKGDSHLAPKNLHYANMAYLENEALSNIVSVPPLYEGGKRIEGTQRTLDEYRKQIDQVASPAIYSAETAYLAAFLYALRCGLENVRYIEYRLNPIHPRVKNPLVLARSIQCGLDDAKAFLSKQGKIIDANLIFSADRQPKHGLEVHSREKVQDTLVLTSRDGQQVFSIGHVPRLDNGVQIQQPAVVRQHDGFTDEVELALQTFNLAVLAKQNGIRVVGFDIQGDELNYDITEFKPVADEIHRYNQAAWQAYLTNQAIGDQRIGVTIHAGETPVSGKITRLKKGLRPLTGSQSVSEAITIFSQPNRYWHAHSRQLGVNISQARFSPLYRSLTPLRIGHGIRANDDSSVIQLAREHFVGFEHCPSSNKHTGVIENYWDLPTVNMSRPIEQGGSGLMVSVSCDNRTIDRTNANTELVRLTRYLGARHADRKRFQFDGAKIAFIFDPSHRVDVIRDLKTHFQTIETHTSPVNQARKRELIPFPTIIKNEANPSEFRKLRFPSGKFPDWMSEADYRP